MHYILLYHTGYILSLLATQALGIDRTYFAAELGLVEPKWITQFPYGYIPHPMIVSQIWALLGLYKAAHFRAEAPYVIPLHVTLYLVHMMQEHFEIYQRYPKEETSVPVNTLGAHDKEVMSKYHYVLKEKLGKGESVASS
jgi:hypothetical protein